MCCELMYTLQGGRAPAVPINADGTLAIPTDRPKRKMLLTFPNAIFATLNADENALEAFKGKVVEQLLRAFPNAIK